MTHRLETIGLEPPLFHVREPLRCQEILVARVFDVVALAQGGGEERRCLIAVELLLPLRFSFLLFARASFSSCFHLDAWFL